MVVCKNHEIYRERVEQLNCNYASIYLKPDEWRYLYSEK